MHHQMNRRRQETDRREEEDLFVVFFFREREFISFLYFHLPLIFDRSYSIDFSMNQDSIRTMFSTKQNSNQ